MPGMRSFAIPILVLIGLNFSLLVSRFSLSACKRQARQ